MKNKINKIIDERPWGKFERFTHNQQTTVKIISVNPNAKLSYQYHNRREEFWRILSGEGQVVINDKTLPARAGDEFFIPMQAKHRAQTTDSAITFLEIAFGDFDEDDIIRIEDEYNRK